MGELGSFHDCEAELDRARLLLANRPSRGAAIASLQRLLDHIESSVDPKVKALAAAVKALLKDADDGVFDANAKAGEVWLSRAGSWSEWMWRFSDSFLRQWTVLIQHFLLVMSVLIFTVTIGAFLARFKVKIQWSVEAVLDATDVSLIAVFCLEALLLLTCTAAKEVLRKLAALRATTASARHVEEGHRGEEPVGNVHRPGSLPSEHWGAIALALNLDQTTERRACVGSLSSQGDHNVDGSVSGTPREKSA